MIIIMNSMEEKMKISKKVKCLHCGQIIECTEVMCVKKCDCGKISINGELIIELY